jgi:hypothetical protein
VIFLGIKTIEVEKSHLVGIFFFFIALLLAIFGVLPSFGIGF